MMDKEVKELLKVAKELTSGSYHFGGPSEETYWNLESEARKLFNYVSNDSFWRMDSSMPRLSGIPWGDLKKLQTIFSEATKDDFDDKKLKNLVIRISTKLNEVMTEAESIRSDYESFIKRKNSLRNKVNSLARSWEKTK
jgi:predicted lipoprotein